MHEFFEHTADLGLRIRAGDLPELFAEAARALFAVIVADCEQIRPEQPMTFELEADRHDDLLRDWLAELLYTFHAEHLLLGQFEVQLHDTRLTAVARGEPAVPGFAEALAVAEVHAAMVRSWDSGRWEDVVGICGD